jgi:hypothetical protein
MKPHPPGVFSARICSICSRISPSLAHFTTLVECSVASSPFSPDVQYWFKYGSFWISCSKDNVLSRPRARIVESAPHCSNWQAILGRHCATASNKGVKPFFWIFISLPASYRALSD